MNFTMHHKQRSQKHPNLIDLLLVGDENAEGKKHREEIESCIGCEFTGERNKSVDKLLP